MASKRKLIKSLDQEFTSDLELSNSPSSSSPDRVNPHLLSLQSPFGRLDNKDCRKTFWLLIATLNAAYPDHDFSRVKVQDFHADSPRLVLLKLSEAFHQDGPRTNFASTLGALSTSPGCAPTDSVDPSDHFSSTSHPYPRSKPDSLNGIHPLISDVLDPVIDLSNCQVYSYSPDPDSDPHAVVSDEDDEEIESVASSIYGQNRPEILQPACPRHSTEETMWEIEGLETPIYIQSHADPTNLSCQSSSLPIRSISTPSSPLTTGSPLGGLSDPSRAPGRASSDQNPYRQDPSHSCIVRSVPVLSPLASSYDSTVEEESAGGLLWSSHYFFYNRKMKRILFISTWGRKAWMTASTAMNESSIAHHPSRDQVDDPSIYPSTSAMTMADLNHLAHPWNQPASPLDCDSIDNSNPIVMTHSRRISSESKPHRPSHLSTTSFKRIVDPSDALESNSSVRVSTRPHKKKKATIRSKGDL